MSCHCPPWFWNRSLMNPPRVMATKAGLLPFGLCGPISLCCEHEHSHWPSFLLAGRYNVYWYAVVSSRDRCLDFLQGLPLFLCATTWAQPERLNYPQDPRRSVSLQQYGSEHSISRTQIFDRKHQLLPVPLPNDSSTGLLADAHYALWKLLPLCRLHSSPTDHLEGCITGAEGSQHAHFEWYTRYTRI